MIGRWCAAPWTLLTHEHTETQPNTQERIQNPINFYIKINYFLMRSDIMFEMDKPKIIKKKNTRKSL